VPSSTRSGSTVADLRARQDARQQIEDGAWALTRELEDTVADRNRWRNLAISWARDALTGRPINPDTAQAAIRTYEEGSDG
jgi:hypothetical protein